jgi:hypothetical protein
MVPVPGSTSTVLKISFLKLCYVNILRSWKSFESKRKIFRVVSGTGKSKTIRIQTQKSGPDTDQYQIVSDPQHWARLGFWNSAEIYPYFVEISMVRFSEISISMSKSEFRFRFRFLPITFDEIETPTTFHPDFIEISMSNSVFLFRFWPRNFDFGIVLLIPESEFRFRHRNSDFCTGFRYQFQNFKAFFYRNKSKFLFPLRIGIWIPIVKIEIPITFDNFVKSRN